MITKHGKPVAKLVPAATMKPKPDVRKVIGELTAFSKGNTLGKGVTIREMSVIFNFFGLAVDRDGQEG